MAGDEETAAAGAPQTFLAMLAYGWQINLILGLMAFAGLFLVFHLLLRTRARFATSPSLLRAVLDDIASGDIEAARKRVETDPSLLASVLLPGLKLHDHPMDRIQQAMESAGRRAVGALRQEAVYLANLGVLAPMLGLLGTVLGLLEAFRVMGETIREGSKSIVLTGAIAEAIVTTVVGLIVGIPAMTAHYLCLSRVNRIGDESEAAAEEVAAALHEAKKP